MSNEYPLIAGSSNLTVGVDVEAWSADLDALAALASTGLAVRTGSGTWALRSLVAGTGVSVSNASGASGNPSLAVDQTFSPTWTGTHQFDASALSFKKNVNVTIQPQSTDDGGAGKSLTILGATGSTNQAGGNVYYGGGASGGGSAAGGDTYVQGGAPGAGGIGGDVILRPHPDAAVGSSGIDVGFAANTSNILLGHAPATIADTTGRLYMYGTLATDLTWATNVAGVIKGYQSSGAPVGLTVTADQGGDASGSNPGSKGGTLTLTGAAGGAGTAGLASGGGGDVLITGHAAAANAGGGGAAGGSVSLRVGAGTGAGINGAINIGADGTVPSAVNIGASTSTITGNGILVATNVTNIAAIVDTTDSSHTVTTLGTNAARMRGIAFKSMTSGIRAVTLPDPTGLGLTTSRGPDSAQAFAHFFVLADGTCSDAHTVYIYTSGTGDATKINGVVSSVTSQVQLVKPFAIAHLWTDGATWWCDYHTESRGLGSSIAAAATIAPVAQVTHITGHAAAIATITAPPMATASGRVYKITLIFDDALATWNATGNIAVAGAATTAGTVVDFYYDPATSKWYPSRVA